MNTRTDHYTFLGVPMDAPPSAIAAAIDRMQHEITAGAYAPAEVGPIREKLRRAEADLLSGPHRREGYDRSLVSSRGVSEPTVVAPLPSSVQQTRYTSSMPPVTPPPVSRPPNNGRWLIPLIAGAALLVGAVGAFAATQLLNKDKSAALATATIAPTTLPTATIAPPTGTSIPRPSDTAAGATATSAVQPSPTSGAPSGDPVAADPAIINSKGYTPTQGHAETIDGSGGTLYAWVGTCTNSADGYCQKVFFFNGTRYLGTDTLNDSVSIRGVIAAGPQTFAVTYAHYGPNDPFCCPSLAPVTIVYHWTGTRLIPSGTPPGH